MICSVATLVCELHLEGIFIELYGDTLVGNSFEKLYETAGSEAYTTLTLGLFHLHTCCEGIFLIAAGDSEHIAGEIDQKVIKNGKGILGVDNLAHGRSGAVENFARYVEFHLYTAVYELSQKYARAHFDFNLQI